MKRALVIANLYHASPRIPGFVTYLPDTGWEVEVVTPPLVQGDDAKLGFPKGFLERTSLVQAPYRGDIFWLWRKLFKTLKFRSDESLTEQLKERVGTRSGRSPVDMAMVAYQTVMAYPDTERTWLAAGARAASRAIEARRFDLILSSSPFPTSHRVAQRMKERFGLPWVADFRDPWTVNHNYPFPEWRRRIERRLEKRTLSDADSIVAATPACAEKISQLHGRTVTPITNGFDPANLLVDDVRLTEKFSLTYTGTIYSGKQDPGPVLSTIHRLVLDGRMDPARIELRFYGRMNQHVAGLIKEYELEAIAKQYGTVARIEAQRRQRESQLLLLLGWEDRLHPGVHQSKLFEYLAAQRPILAAGGFEGNETSRIIAETGAGKSAFDKAQLETTLMAYYEEFLRSGEIPYGGDRNLIHKYSYAEGAKQLAEVMNSCTRTNSRL